MSGAGGLSEFALIQRFFQPLSKASAFVRCGIGDDCAVLSPAAGEELALSVDTLVEGVHFPHDYPPSMLARRALAACVSDLAAAGAEPRAFTLALTLLENGSDWLAAFSHALADDAAHYGMSLVGGDTTRGPLCLSFQVMGSVPVGGALLRSGAKPGDDIYVSGSLGGARAALDYLDSDSPDARQQACLERYHRPQARVALGVALRGIASAAVDISDGLAADLGHILNASGAGGRLMLGALPIHPAIKDLSAARDYALSGGDDYELCFTAPAEQRESIAALSVSLGLPLTCVGGIVPGDGLSCIDENGQACSVGAGYQHF